MRMTMCPIPAITFDIRKPSQSMPSRAAPSRRFMLAFAVMLVAICPGTGSADDRAMMLIDRELTRTEIILHELDASADGRSVVGRVRDNEGPDDGRRRWNAGGANAVLALIRPEARVERDERNRILELADGQRIVGRQRIRDSANETGDDGPTITWLRGDDFSITVELDAVRRVIFDETARDLEAADADAVLLRNGDRLEGYVLSLADPLVIELEPDDPAEEPRIVEIGLNRVSGVAMLTPSQPVDDDRPFSVWLNDGSMLHVAEVRNGGERAVTIGLGGDQRADAERRATLPLGSIIAMVFDRNAWRPLAERRPQRVDGPPTRYTVPDPQTVDPEAPAGLSAVTFHGPMTAWYDLPDHPVRLAADVELPPQARVWGRVRLIVRCDGEAVAEHRFDGRSPRHALDVVLDGSELEIELAEAGSGPVQNVLTFHNALLGPAGDE